MPFPPPTPKQARILWMSLTGLAIAVFVGLLGLLAWALGWLVNLLSPILWPLAIAAVLAYLLDPMVDFFARRNVPRARAIILVFIICVAAVAAVLGQVVPRVVFETKHLIERVPEYSKRVQEDFSGWVSRTPLLLEWKQKFLGDRGGATNAAPPLLTPNVTNDVGSSTNQVADASAPIVPDRAWANRLAESALEWLAGVLPEVGQWLGRQFSKVASWAGMIVGLALVPVFVFYFLIEKQGIQGGWADYLPIQESKFKEELVFVITAINDYLIAFFRGQVVVAICIGGLLTMGFAALGLNYAVLLGLMAGVLSIVPYLGAVLTIVPAVVLAMVQFKDWWHPLLVVGVFAAVQMLEGLVISPKIMGDRVGLHPLTIIVAVLVGTMLLGGILGGVLAIPLTAALRVIMFRYVWKQREV